MQMLIPLSAKVRIGLLIKRETVRRAEEEIDDVDDETTQRRDEDRIR